MLALGNTGTIPTTSHIPLPAGSVPHRERKKPTGLQWAPSANPKVWAEARNENLCAHPNCLVQPTGGTHCARHKPKTATAPKPRKTAPSGCTVEDCDQPHEARGMCNKHYSIWHYHHGNHTKHTRTCATCGTEFTTTSTKARTCSKKCSSALRWANRRKNAA